MSILFINACVRENSRTLVLAKSVLSNYPIHFIETFGYKRFIDGGFTKGTKAYNSNLETLKKFIKSYSSKYEDVTHFAYTFLDDHDDHEALGSALTSLYYDSNETGFENVYLIILIINGTHEKENYKTSLKNMIL